MKKNQNDRHLDIPAEANRDKRVNFLARERGETDPAVEKDSRQRDDEKTSDKVKHDEDLE